MPSAPAKRARHDGHLAERAAPPPIARLALSVAYPGQFLRCLPSFGLKSWRNDLCSAYASNTPNHITRLLSPVISTEDIPTRGRPATFSPPRPGAPMMYRYDQAVAFGGFTWLRLIQKTFGCPFHLSQRQAANAFAPINLRQEARVIHHKAP